MSDPRLELFARLEQTLASLEATFLALGRTPSTPASGGAAADQPDGPPDARRSPARSESAEGVLTPEEEERIVRQLRALREEVRVLGETLQNPPLDPIARKQDAPRDF